MNMEQVVERLKQEAALNPVSRDFFTVLADRNRTRNVIMMTNLMQRMKKKGFYHERKAYFPVLKLLSELGLGTIKMNTKHGIRGLTDIKVTLSSIGKAALGGKDDTKLKEFKIRNKFIELPISSKRPANRSEVNVSLDINGKVVSIPLPRDLNANDIAVLITKLQSA